MKKKSIALIPARSGSRRVPNKNIKNLNEHPLLAYSIRAAIESDMFESVICCTDSEEYADIARYYGAEVPFLRPTEISTENSPDIEWVRWVLSMLEKNGRAYELFSILRPTSPFRTAQTIKRAFTQFLSNDCSDSLRAIEKCKQHPGKMWIVQGNSMMPLLPFSSGSAPWHSNQYKSLPEVFVQNASLEIAWTRLPLTQQSISGVIIKPFITDGLEGFDINDQEDWLLAELYVGKDPGILPKIIRAKIK